MISNRGFLFVFVISFVVMRGCLFFVDAYNLMVGYSNF